MSEEEIRKTLELFKPSKPSGKIKLIGSEEFAEFMKYCEEAKGLGIDLKQYLALVKRNFKSVRFYFRKEEFEVTIDWDEGLFGGGELNVTFESSKRSRRFTLYEEAGHRG